MVPFAKRMDYMAGSADVIKKLFQAMGDPETISFGGGAPAKETLPGIFMPLAVAGIIIRRKNAAVRPPRR